MHRMRVIVLISLAILATVVIGLSKSDGEAKIREEQEELKREVKERKKKKEEEHKTIGQAMRNAGSEPLEFRPRALTKSSILDDHQETYEGPKKYPDMPTMAYITPWNNAGYDRAVRVASLLSIVSPVWLQLKPSPERERECTITGTHDIDQGWLGRLREANGKLKILPRLIIEEFSPQQLKDLFTSDTASANCIRKIIDLLESADMDGIVLEGWLPVLRAAHQAAFDAGDAIETFSSWGKALHVKGKMIVLPIPPPVDASMQLMESVWNDAYWDLLGDSIDYIQIMTHDYYPTERGTTVFPQAPVRWVEQNLRAVIGRYGEHANRVLLGLYHYGFKTDFSRQQQGAVMAKEFLETLENEEAELEWDPETQEHFVRLGKMQMFFPTLASLEIRTRMAHEYGSGISIWDLGQGLEHFSRVL
ncbi:hypothetical protein PMAYCL1PPCAC_02098 [Pristionchus mayeri]|uniref:Chitinase domain-containing protein 1 n=1 Tax=Pristionchus mayeri TaxID=1317129 RepID=A0AAN4Z4R9_9BILA|nr:hypothetical protein PMAYCL1PPCAC_02098 [Pristionchus mayeri]